MRAGLRPGDERNFTHCPDEEGTEIVLMMAGQEDKNGETSLIAPMRRGLKLLKIRQIGPMR